MRNNPVDMFDEMDEMFARLFARVDREFMAGFMEESGYRIQISEDEEAVVDGEAMPVIAADFHPTADVQRLGDEIKVVADLPGITAESLRLGMRNGKLVIDAGDAGYTFNTSVVLPPVDAASMQYTIKNGVLEVTFRDLSVGVSPAGINTP